MLSVLLSIVGDGGLLESVGDIAFVVKLMAFVYVVFYLYQTFAESQVLFGLSVLGAGYFILLYSSVFVALAIVVLLMVTGMWLQQSLQFGLFPLLGIGQGMPMGGGASEEEMHAIQQKMALGQQLSQEEMQMMQAMEQQQMQQSQYNAQYMRQIGMRGRR